MSRAAARAGYERFLDATVAAVREEFSVARALRGTGLGPGGVLVDRLRSNVGSLERLVVEPELATYRDRARAQFEVVLEYAAGEDPIEAYEAALLEHDSYYESLDPGVPGRKREAVVEAILARNRRLGDGVAPIVEHPEDDFWAAAQGAFDREEATELVAEAFPFTDPIRRHRDAIVFEVRIDPGDVLGPVGAALPGVGIDYTGEAIRAMTRAERRVVREMKAEVRERFEG